VFALMLGVLRLDFSIRQRMENPAQDDRVWRC
jgi:hypothetical protein